MFTFSWGDIWRLLTAKQNKIVRYGMWCAVVAFVVSIATPLKYEAQAIFKQSVVQPGKSVDLKKLIQAVSIRQPSESVAGVLLSDAVLGKVVQALGLQVEQSQASLLTTMKNNLLAEMGLAKPVEPSFVFSSVTYTGEKELSLWIEPLSTLEFQLRGRRGKVVASGLLGEPVLADTFTFTLHSLPSRGRIILKPESLAIAALRKYLLVKPSREDPGLLRIRSTSFFRSRSRAIANTLMEMYKELLVEENELVIGAQLSYLGKRQDELEKKLSSEAHEHASHLGNTLHAEGILGIKGEGDELLAPLYACTRRLREIELALEKIGLNEQTASLSPRLIKRYSELLAQDTLRKQILQEGETFIQAMETDLSAISLSAAEALVEQYSRQMDTLHTGLKEAIFMRDHLFDPEFEIGALSTVLSDPVSERIISQAVTLESELREDFRSLKEKNRLKIALSSHKKLLVSHLERTLELGKVRVSLIKEKIGTLLGAMKRLLLQEKTSVENQIEKLKHSMQPLPYLWADEHKLHFKEELTKTIMKGLTHITESKNLDHHLYQVESRPLDQAKLPLKPTHPHLILNTALFFVLGLFLSSCALIMPPLFRGEGASLATMRELGFHVSGSANDPATFEKLALFLLEENKAQIVACVGERQVNLLPTLTSLLKKQNKSSCIINCSLEKIPPSESGLIQALEGNIPSLQHHTSYDFLPTGGFAPHSALLLSSSPFHALLQALSQKYDFLFLSVQLPSDASASQAVLSACHTAIISLSRFSSRDKTHPRATYIQYPVIVEQEGLL